MDKHANQMDQSSIAGLPHPQLPPHLQTHPQLPPHPQTHPQLPPHPQHQHLGPHHPTMYQHVYRPMAPPPYHGYATGHVTPSYYPSAPPTVQFQMQGYGYGYEQQLEMPHAPVGAAEGSSARRAKRRHISMEQGPVQHAPVGAAGGSSARRAKRRRISMEQGPVQDAQVGTAEGSSHPIFHKKYPDFELVVVNSEILYKCPLLHCGEEILGNSIGKHLGTNKHLNQSSQLPCPYCGKKLSRGDSLTRHIKYCDEAPKNVDAVPQGPGAAPVTVVVQPTVAVPQASFTFQPVWDPRSGTQQSLPSTEDATSLALASAAPLTVDEDDDTAWGESLEHDNNTLESDAVPGHLDDTDDSTSGDKALDNLLNSLDWD